MDTSSPCRQADDAARPIAPGATFVGKILWIALAIGVACLALLTLVGSVAHAAPTPATPALLQPEAAMRARTAAPIDRNPPQFFAMAADHRGSSRRSERRARAEDPESAAVVGALRR